MERSLRCRVGVHTWKVRREPGVEPYLACRRCGKAKLVDLRGGTVARGTSDMIEGYRKKP
ncbi:hypothetical protein [Nocardioides sediminis]|uniref:hypothetical protein n=1 Tax=Nocardioides sediminis TaxID=433648 RepID=UPI000D3223ED|nr:hypothetical protein [Nocardioides sediminis]